MKGMERPHIMLMTAQVRSSLRHCLKLLPARQGADLLRYIEAYLKLQSSQNEQTITFQEKGIRSQVKVAEDDKIIVAAAQLEPMRNPVTGKIHRAIIELPTGFESNKLETSSLKNMFADDGFLNFK